MMHRNSVVLLVVAAILLGMIAEGMVVRGNEPKPGVTIQDAPSGRAI